MRYLILLTLITLSACAQPTPPPLVVNTSTPPAVGQPDDPQRDEAVIPNQDGDGPDMNVIVDLPPNHEQRSSMPVLLFLHDEGTQGTDINLIRQFGRPQVMLENPSDYPFIIVIPQLPDDTSWGNYTRTLRLTLALVHNQYESDRERVYMAGHGIGGYGVLTLARFIPGDFAAGVVSGGLYVGQPTELCEVDVPLHLYHGTNDFVVPMYAAERVSGALEDCGIAHVFTIIEGADHNQTADTVFESAATYDWLLEQ